MQYNIPRWWFFLCVTSSVISVMISAVSIVQQLLNYRKPFEQRLVIRIQLMVPLFCVTCLLACVSPRKAEVWVDPIREIYEASFCHLHFLLAADLDSRRGAQNHNGINDGKGASTASHTNSRLYFVSGRHVRS